MVYFFRDLFLPGAYFSLPDAAFDDAISEEVDAMENPIGELLVRMCLVVVRYVLCNVTCTPKHFTCNRLVLYMLF